VFGVLGMGMSRVIMSIVLVMMCGLVSATASHQHCRRSEQCEFRYFHIYKDFAVLNIIEMALDLYGKGKGKSKYLHSRGSTKRRTLYVGRFV
jgi:hypothetical protein